MAALGVQLVEGLLDAAKTHRNDRALLLDFFMNNLGAEQETGPLAARVLETVLKHIEHNENMTALHKQVMLNLITVLKSPTIPGAQDSAAPITEQAQEIHEAGGEEIRPFEIVRGKTMMVAQKEEDPIEQAQKVIKKEQPDPTSSAMPKADSSSAAEQKNVRRRMKFLQSVCDESESTKEDLPEETQPDSPTQTQILEHRRGASGERIRLVREEWGNESGTGWEGLGYTSRTIPSDIW
ncbi:hypothetical protein F5B19DRAFT_495972 [Rostrohypoxylon terebratum]|nr:hypothetical protein F5B19DRAFT_495972 [Rostrohypoxylon terebratum]